MWPLLATAIATACPGTTTPQVTACLSEQLSADVAVMTLYRLAALERIAAGNAGDSERVRTAFLAAEQAWYAWRAAECGAVHENWSQGSIRGIMGVQCMRRITRLRTHALWANWLTFADSTPPSLPEPAIGLEP